MIVVKRARSWSVRLAVPSTTGLAAWLLSQLLLASALLSTYRFKAGAERFGQSLAGYSSQHKEYESFSSGPNHKAHSAYGS